MALLRLIKGLSPGKTFSLKENEYILGRGHDCEIQLEMPAVTCAPRMEARASPPPE